MATIQIKAKKKIGKGLFIRLNNPEEKDIPLTLNELNKRIFHTFKYHIGKENGIPAHDVFKEIFKIEPDSLDVFQRNYLWEVLQRIFMKLRSREELFIVHSSRKYFVLQTKDEAEVFKEKIDRTIKALNSTKKKADAWVAKQKWKTL